MKIAVNIIGEKQLIEKLKKLGVEGENVIEETVVDVATKITNEAKSNARNKGVFDNGQLVQGIILDPIDKFNAYVRSTMFYSAFHEFGTGGMVDIPPNWGEVAAQFKGRGIKRINIQPRPFMYPAFVEGRSIYFKTMKKAIKELLNKMK